MLTIHLGTEHGEKEEDKRGEGVVIKRERGGFCQPPCPPSSLHRHNTQQTRTHTNVIISTHTSTAQHVNKTPLDSYTVCLWGNQSYTKGGHIPVCPGWTDTHAQLVYCGVGGRIGQTDCSWGDVLALRSSCPTDRERGRLKSSYMLSICPNLSADAGSGMPTSTHL